MITSKQSKEARAALGFSQADVSRGTKIGRSYISQFESGVRKLEKRDLLTLIEFYEFSGYKLMKSDSVLSESDSIQEKLDGMVEKGQSEVGLSIIDLSDLIHLISDKHSVEPVKNPSECNIIDDVFVCPGMMKLENINKVVGDHVLADKAIKDHFILDNKGGTNSGFFGVENVAIKLINSMALQYVRMVCLRDGILFAPLVGFDGFELENLGGGNDAKEVSKLMRRYLGIKQPDLEGAFKHTLLSS